MAAVTEYDRVLVLRIHSEATLASPSLPAGLLFSVSSAAKATSKRLLVHLPATPLWDRLALRRQANFQLVQAFLARLYVLASSKLDEDAGVDIVIECLRRHTQDGESIAETAKETLAGSSVSEWEDDPAGAKEGAQCSLNAEEQELGTVALGGTFDHLHPGHRILLTMACWLAERRVIVGITDDILLGTKSDRDLLESLEHRTQAVRSFLKLVCPGIQHDTPALQDVYGPTAHDPDVQGVLVSEETRKGAASIAEIRAKKGLSELKLFVIGVISPEQVLDVDTTSKEELAKTKMGSTAIRRRLKERMQAQKTS